MYDAWKERGPHEDLPSVEDDDTCCEPGCRELAVTSHDVGEDRVWLCRRHGMELLERRLARAEAVLARRAG